MSNDIEPLLTVEDVTRLLSLSRTKIYELMDAGELAYCRFGRARRVPPSVIREFIAASQTLKPHNECGGEAQVVTAQGAKSTRCHSAANGGVS